ncbi:hypothetical protein MSIMFI_03309 [Mycobacterium simulans]|nr:hypothetical protein MSIMFI_03309 [Mycobacterium simulans]
MNVTRVSEAPTYVAPAHHDVCTMRLQGLEENAPTQEETVYVVLDGALVVTTLGAETVLGRLDSMHLAKGEVRSVYTVRTAMRC